MFPGVGLSFRMRVARSIFWLAWSRGVLQVLSFVVGALRGGARGAIMLSTPVYCVLMTIMAREALAEVERSFPSSGTRFGRFWPVPW